MTQDGQWWSSDSRERLMNERSRVWYLFATIGKFFIEFICFEDKREGTILTKWLNSWLIIQTRFPGEITGQTRCWYQGWWRRRSERRWADHCQWSGSGISLACHIYVGRAVKDSNVSISEDCHFCCLSEQTGNYFKSNIELGWSPGLVVMGRDSSSKGCGFESQHHILDGHFSTFILL